ncbi:MAG: hypothetical protein ABIU95_08110 [Burkholderiales bacterium]
MAPSLELRLGALPHRAALVIDLEQRLAALAARYASLMRCRVFVERANSRAAIDVNMELLMPGREIVVGTGRPRTELDAALTDAFGAAESALARHANH